MIFTYVITAIIAVITLIIQGHTSFDVIRIAGVKPDLQFIFIIYLGYSFGPFYGEVTGFLGGLLHDAISNTPLGLMAFPKMALGCLVGLMGRNILKSNILTVTAMIFIASLVKGVLTLFVCYMFHQSFISSVISIIIPEAFYNALLAPGFFVLFDKIFERDLEREGAH